MKSFLFAMAILNVFMITAASLVPANIPFFTSIITALKSMGVL